MSDLRDMSLLAPADSDEALDDEIDNTGALLVFQTDTEAEILMTAGFVERREERAN